MKTLNFVISEDLHTKFKIHCIKRNKKMTEVLINIIKKEVQKNGD